MLGLGSLMKIAKGGLSEKDLMAVLAGMGIRAELEEIPMDDAAHAFRNAAILLSKDGASLTAPGSALRTGHKSRCYLFCYLCHVTPKK